MIRTHPQEAAELMLAEKTTEYQQPEKPELIERFVDEYAQACLRDITTEGDVEPRIIASYQQLFRPQIARTLGGTKLRDLTPLRVKVLLNAERDQLSENGQEALREGRAPDQGDFVL